MAQIIQLSTSKRTFFQFEKKQKNLKNFPFIFTERVDIFSFSSILSFSSSFNSRSLCMCKCVRSSVYLLWKKLKHNAWPYKEIAYFSFLFWKDARWWSPAVGDEKREKKEWLGGYSPMFILFSYSFLATHLR